jgi:hypothetical protein
VHQIDLRQRNLHNHGGESHIPFFSGPCLHSAISLRVHRADECNLFSQAILDFSQDLDVTLLDRIVTAMFSGNRQEVSLRACDLARSGQPGVQVLRCVETDCARSRCVGRSLQQNLAQQVLTQFQGMCIGCLQSDL